MAFQNTAFYVFHRNKSDYGSEVIEAKNRRV